MDVGRWFLVYDKVVMNDLTGNYGLETKEEELPAKTAEEALALGRKIWQKVKLERETQEANGAELRGNIRFHKGNPNPCLVHKFLLEESVSETVDESLTSA